MPPRDYPSIAICVRLPACDPLLSNFPVELKRSLLSTAPALVSPSIELSALGCVDPVKADALAVDLDSIAVDHRGPAHDVGQGRCGHQQEQGAGEYCQKASHGRYCKQQASWGGMN